MHINRPSLILYFSLFSMPLFSIAQNGGGVEKKKTINKSYQVTANDKLVIENSFGDVVINTWDKNEIQVDVEIGTEASTDEKAQRILDEIVVNEERSGNTISFKTDVGEINDHGNHKGRGKDGNRTFHIDYTVHMPAGNPLDIENSFGRIKVGDIKGEVSLTSKFGGLTTGKLDNVDDIDVEFGDASIGQIHNGKITFKFNSKSHIAKVSGTAKINSEFSGNVQFVVDDNIEELMVNESYSTVKMIVSKELSANFEIHTNFGSFNNNTDFNIKEEKEDENDGPRFDKDYSGKIGNGNAKIKIKSSFGKVRLTTSDAKDEMDEKQDQEERTEKAEKKERKEKKEKKEKVSI